MSGKAHNEKNAKLSTFFTVLSRSIGGYRESGDAQLVSSYGAKQQTAVDETYPCSLYKLVNLFVCLRGSECMIACGERVIVRACARVRLCVNVRVRVRVR